VHVWAATSGYYRQMDTSVTRRFSAPTPAVFDAVYAVALTGLAWFSLAVRPVFMIPGVVGRRPDSIPGSRGATAAPDPSVVDTATAGGRAPQFRPEPSLQSYALVAVAFLPLIVRRRFPLSVLAVTSLAAAAYEYLSNPPSMVFLAPLIALYTVGTLRGRRTLIIAGVLAAAVQLVVALPAWSDTTYWAEVVRIISMFGVAAALGDATRNRRAYVAEVEQRAIDAERTRDEVAARRVDEERLRIARELHDVTAHSLSIIAVQSGAASHVLDSDPAEARRALEAIRRTSKDALGELRAMLGVLRSAEDTDAPLAPTPGLARLSELMAPLAEAGVSATLNVDGDIADVPAVVDASAYRIVQEALTNIVRHAGPCDVVVTLGRTDTELVVNVADTGRGVGVAGVSEGHGLTGMRERAAALGGSFESGPAAEGGFAITARLPVASRGGRSS